MRVDDQKEEADKHASLEDEEGQQFFPFEDLSQPVVVNEAKDWEGQMEDSK